MKTLKQIVNEELIPSIYYNIRPSTLMNLAKEHGSTRFIIDSDNKLHAGAAQHFIHSELNMKNMLTDYEKYKNYKSGVITYDKEKNEHIFGVDRDNDHKLLTDLEKRGVKRGRIDGDWSTIKAVPRIPPVNGPLKLPLRKDKVSP